MIYCNCVFKFCTFSIVAFLENSCPCFSVFLVLLWLINVSTHFGFDMLLVICYRKPTAMLRGHSAPIFFIFIADEENRIFSISTDKCIKVGVSRFRQETSCWIVN